MRYAVLSDIHGNAEALEAVLRDISGQSIDAVVCLGDIVGYYPDPQRCIELTRAHTTHCLAGNHDYAAIGLIDTNNFTYYAFVAMEWTRQHISESGREFLQSLSLSLEVDGLFFTHSSPVNPEEWIYVWPDSDEAVFEAFKALRHKITFIGHTHWPSIMIHEDGKIALHHEHSVIIDGAHDYLINVGSVGQPRDADPRSCYGIYDSDKRCYAEVRVAYDYSVTQKKIVAQHLPLYLAERLEKGR